MFILFPGRVTAEPVTEIRLAATDWCPYTCANTNGSNKNGVKGIVADYITAILADHNIRVHIQTYPWSRAVALAKQGGKIDGLLTAVPGEAPGLSLTSTPTMTYQDCFFTRADDVWRYESPASLKGQNRILGVIAGYGYSDEVMAHLNDPFNRKTTYVMSGQNALWRLLQQLEIGRVDILIDDPNIVNWTRQHHNTHPAATQVRKASCQPAKPFYIALNPDKPWTPGLLKTLNTALKEPQNQELLASIIGGYLGKVR